MNHKINLVIALIQYLSIQQKNTENGNNFLVQAKVLFLLHTAYIL